MVLVGAVVLVGVALFRPAVHAWLISRRKQLALAGVSLCLTLAMLEGATRTWMSLTESPYYWRWGTHDAMQLVRYGNVNSHSLECAGYFKFEPNQVLHQGAYSHSISTRINNLGFRGPDITTPRPDDVTRVVCLGGSSTFGYYARDEWTYPACLERKLNESAEAADARYEVINLGIPHLDSDAIVRLVEREVAELDPQIVVLYAGTNDTPCVPERPASGFGQVFGAVDRVVAPRVLLWHELSRRWEKPHYHTSEFIAQATGEKAERYVANLQWLAEWCDKRAVELVLVTQQHTCLHGAGRPEDLACMTYQQEYEQVRQAVAEAGGTWLGNEAYLLIHAELMQRLREFAIERHLRVADGIAALDGHRTWLCSWVHLEEPANAVLAEVIAAQVLNPAYAGGVRHAEHAAKVDVGGESS